VVVSLLVVLQSDDTQSVEERMKANIQEACDGKVLIARIGLNVVIATGEHNCIGAIEHFLKSGQWGAGYLLRLEGVSWTGF